MINNKDLYNLNKEGEKMKINIPPYLNNEELKSFNEIVKPQLEELYSYNYDQFEFKNAKIFISKGKFPDKTKNPDIEEIKNNDKEIKGRTLPIIYKIIIYPKVQEKINNVLIHEIGHVLFDKLLNLKQKTEISQIAFMASIRALSYTKIERYKFVQEYFASAYGDFLNEKMLVSRNPLLLQFLTKELF